MQETPTQNHFKVWKLKYKGYFFNMLLVKQCSQSLSLKCGGRRGEGEYRFLAITPHVIGTNIRINGVNMGDELKKKIVRSLLFLTNLHMLYHPYLPTGYRRAKKLWGLVLQETCPQYPFHAHPTKYHPDDINMRLPLGDVRTASSGKDFLSLKNIFRSPSSFFCTEWSP